MRYTLITGGSSGIGYQFARQSAERGENLILVSNQLSALQAVSESISKQYGVDVRVLDTDLSAADAAERVYAFAASVGEVDTLISNAGVLHFGKFLNTTDCYIDFITALHFTTPMKLCKLFASDGGSPKWQNTYCQLYDCVDPISDNVALWLYKGRDKEFCPVAVV